MPMPFFVAQRQPTPLPPLGLAIEHAVMDWKVKATATPFEKAQDVAAFANHLGGTLLIGAHERNGQLAAYVGMSPTDAATVRDEFSKAVAQRCQPPPTVEFEEYEDPNDPLKRVIAINVWPSLNLVGVKVEVHRTEGYAGPSFVYPIRSGTDTIRLEPTQLAMYMTPQVRRIAVMLSRIPQDALVKIIREPRTVGQHEFDARFDSVLEEQNLAKFWNKDDNGSVHIPLDRILTVYEDEKKLWKLVTDSYR